MAPRPAAICPVGSTRSASTRPWRWSRSPPPVVPRRPGRPGGDGQIHHHGRAPRRLGGRARGGIGARAGTLGGGGRGPGRRARHRHREHGEVAQRTPTGARAADRAGGPAAARPAGASERAFAGRRRTAWPRTMARRRLRRGQLVIVDEASLAGTFALDELVSAARDAGAKVLLVGDQAQLSAAPSRRHVHRSCT